jgi:Trypsin
VNGANADNGQFPWSGRVVHPSFSCSCTLIALDRVITSAACVRGMPGGTTFFGNVTRNGGVQRTFRPEDIFLHPRDGEDQGFNLAILRLSIPYVSSSLILPVDLPFDPDNFFENMSGLLSGFGLMASSVTAQILQWTPMTVATLADCTATFGVRESVLCGHWATSALCDGDFGAGLVLQVAGKWRLIGVHNFRLASNDCVPGTMFGFVRVSDHLDWILSI